MLKLEKKETIDNLNSFSNSATVTSYSHYLLFSTLVKRISGFTVLVSDTKGKSFNSIVVILDTRTYEQMFIFNVV